MSIPPISALTDAVLADLYDPGALLRGRTYAAEGRVQLLQSKPGGLRAVVAGSGRNTYVVVVDWTDGRGGIQVRDGCSCPLGDACKHAVAAILTARAAVAPAADWRRALAGIGDDRRGGAPVGAEPLAIQVSVGRPRQTSWGGTVGAEPKLRPLRLGRAGRWIKTGASWRDLGSPGGYRSNDLRPDHVAAVRALLSTAKLPSYYPDDQPVSLTHFGPTVWAQLAQVQAAGVELVGEGSAHRPAVRLVGEAAVPTIDLRGGADGAVTVVAEVVLDGQAVVLAPGDAGLIGNPAHGLWRRGPDGLDLVALASPVPTGLADLLAAGPVVVPAADVDELLTTYQPRLARVAAVASSDGSVAIVPTVFERLVLRIERPAVDVAEVYWLARYRRGDRTTDHPLFAPAGADSPRDPAAERAAVDALDLPTDLVPELRGPVGELRQPTLTRGRAVALLAEAVPRLEAGGVLVEVVGTAPALREAIDDPLISLSVRDPAGAEEGADGPRTDWFDLDIEVTVDGEPVPFVPLFAALTTDQEVMILPSGTWLRLDRPELARLKELIDEARGLADADGDAAARVNRFQAAWWDELVGLGVVRHQSERWAESIAHMGALAAPEPVPVPVALDATLRHYQQEGLDWLAFLHRHRLGGILADDMGLGKTVQTIALFLHVLETQPDARFLVVAPTSVVENWRREVARFAPGVGVSTVTETAARRGGVPLAEAVAGATVVVTSYALFRLEFEQYAALGWDLLLLDEAQFVKNHQGKTHQCVRRLDVPTKIALTGTPLENSLMDLWSLLSITAPGLYPDPKRFAAVYRKPIESGAAPELLATLRRRIAPLMRRRTKDQVLTELPPKIEQTVEVELSPKHQRIYQTQLQRQRQKVLGLVGNVQQQRFEILKSLTILRQLSLDPGLVDPADDHVGSAKLDRLEEDLLQVLAEGHRALVFSQFTRYLARVRERLDRAGVAHAYLDGKTRDRAGAIERFTSGEVPVFVISLKAGGFGLNLTQADYCFVLDPWWNPAAETQAVDRAHRIGQVNPVVVYRYVATDTIEEKVMELKARKSALFDQVVDADGALAGALSEADLRGLFDLPGSA